MKYIKEVIKANIELRAREVFSSPGSMELRGQDVLTLVSSMLIKLNRNSFVNIEHDMHKFPVLRGIDFRFLKENPNSKYKLVKGIYESSTIEARLITDGVKVADTMLAFGKNFIMNPLNPSRKITLEASTLEKVEISDATFAIEEYLVDDRTEFVRFISEITDREELLRIANLISQASRQDDVQVLTLKNKMM